MSKGNVESWMESWNRKRAMGIINSGNVSKLVVANVRC